MLDALNITEAEAEGLSQLAAAELALALDFAARARAAEDPETASALGRSCQRAARSYRQCLALKARLRRELAQAAAADAAARETAEPRAARVAERKNRLRDEVERLVWSERETLEFAEADAKAITAALEARLAALAARPDFLHEAAEVLVRDLLVALDPLIDAAYAAIPRRKPAAEPPEPPPCDSG